MMLTSGGIPEGSHLIFYSFISEVAHFFPDVLSDMLTANDGAHKKSF
jgi:hypothetical protein